MFSKMEKLLRFSKIKHLISLVKLGILTGSFQQWQKSYCGSYLSDNRSNFILNSFLRFFSWCTGKNRKTGQRVSTLLTVFFKYIFLYYALLVCLL